MKILAGRKYKKKDELLTGDILDYVEVDKIIISKDSIVEVIAGDIVRIEIDVKDFRKEYEEMYFDKIFNEERLYLGMLNKYGFNKQGTKLIEEMAELTQAITKQILEGNQDTFLPANFIEEIVDVEIMLGQIKLLINTDHEKGIYDSYKKEKLKRISIMLEGDN